ncbi:MAG TPA: aspartate aminotransferase family protein [Candidatus Omnitrophica bacterium]|nr:aspartate aminotransferase family protein [Candidatus Omnitrophota bacterium]
MKNDDVAKLYSKYVMDTYTHTPLSLAKGKGSRVWDLQQNEYLDFFPGWGVSVLGHCPNKVVAGIKSQSKKIIHVSNNYYNHLQARLAQKLVKISQMDAKVFFCNSGAEANEAAFKLARLYGGGLRYKIITMNNSFHGRTLAALSATGQEKYKKGFEPLPEGFMHAAFNNPEEVKDKIDSQTAAVMLELVQGEGGINVADQEYVRKLRNLCDENNILLIIDEVQTGMGRTGKWFSYHHYGIEPDIITLAKGIAGGLPMGAVLAKDKVADLIKPGMHASTFGGSPLVSKAALAVIDTIMKKNLLRQTAEKGEYLKTKLLGLKSNYGIIKKVRGLGLMLGLELCDKGKEVFELCLKNRLLVNLTQGNILRIMPAMNVTYKEIDRAVAVLDRVFRDIVK